MLKLMNKWKGFLVLSLVALCLLNCKDDSSDSPAKTENVMLNTNEQLGKILTDKDGKTLYFFTKDVSGTSACTAGCLAKWPAFFEEEIKPGAGLNASDFATITRSDGAKQTTYKGWPLYYYADDAVKGDVKGEKVGNVWYVAKPDYSLMLADADIQYLVDFNGKTLYYFTVDTPDVSNCTGGCLAAWPEFNTENVVVPSSLNPSDFKKIARSDGKEQITYKGKPLYYYSQDAVRGDNKGRGVNEKWYEITP